MSIIVLTPKPPQAQTAAANTSTIALTETSLVARIGDDFLHLMGHEGYRFDTFEQLRDYAQAQIDAAATLATLAAKTDAPAAAPEVALAPAADSEPAA
jgi:hypothetical protein